MGRRRLECHADYERALRNQYGIGVGDAYTPWIRVQDVSSDGLSTKLPGIRVNRDHHLLSKLEKRCFLFAEFDRTVIDIREQFPLLPLPLAEKIAVEAGIRYPVHPKTKYSRIQTTDFLLTIATSAGVRYLAIAVKPSSELSRKRILELLELDRLWWALLGIPWLLVTEYDLDEVASENLDWLSDPLRGIKKLELENELPPNARSIIAAALVPGVYKWESLVELASKTIQCGNENAKKLLRVMAWERIVEIDLKSSIQRTGLVKIEQINIRRLEDGIYGAAS